MIARVDARHHFAGNGRTKGSAADGMGRRRGPNPAGWPGKRTIAD